MRKKEKGIIPMAVNKAAINLLVLEGMLSKSKSQDRVFESKYLHKLAAACFDLLIFMKENPQLDNKKIYASVENIFKSGYLLGISEAYSATRYYV